MEILYLQDIVLAIPIPDKSNISIHAGFINIFYSAQKKQGMDTCRDKERGREKRFGWLAFGVEKMGHKRK